jgi:hypothetical protein
MFKTRSPKNTLVNVVIDKELAFLLFDKNGSGRVLKKVPLEQFLNDSPELEPTLFELRDKTNSLLILPDYWLGTTSYEFQSKKSYLAKAFIERKLSTDYPDLPDAKYFYDFTFSQNNLKSPTLYVYFLQDIRAFKLYQKLSELHLNPAQITTPALIWEQKLSKAIPDFNTEGTCLIHLLYPTCFLYFFFQDRFLFSRNITIPELQVESNDDSTSLSMESSNSINVMTYEINQSLYLFSQNTKTDMGKIYLLSSDKENAHVLSDSLGREVISFGADIIDQEGLKASSGISEDFGPVEPFHSTDLISSKLHLNLTHTSLKRMLEWKPVQKIGIAVGLILLFLLATESLFLWQWPQIFRGKAIITRSIDGVEQKQLIEQYSETLDLILAETDRPIPRRVITNIGRSIPDNIWITDMDIETETDPGVVMTGIIRASGVDQLKSRLSTLLGNMNQYFQGTRSLGIQDIDFKADKSSKDRTPHQFLFTLKFSLP